MRYTAKYFKDGLPEWKYKKDAVLIRFIYRPISFWLSSLAANLKISANAVSYFSALVALAACGLYLFNNYVLNICGSVLINLWLLLDCVDGNIARSVKQHPFGEFADSLSSYLLVGLMCTAISFSVYSTGGILLQAGVPWIMLIGALASSADSLMRLAYQKYNNTAKALQEKGVIPMERDVRQEQSSVRSLQVRIEMELGIGGILPAFILVATISHALDLVVIYCFVYFTGACVISILRLIIKTIRLSKESKI